MILLMLHSLQQICLMLLIVVRYSLTNSLSTSVLSLVIVCTTLSILLALLIFYKSYLPRMVLIRLKMIVLPLSLLLVSLLSILVILILQLIVMIPIFSILSLFCIIL